MSSEPIQNRRNPPRTPDQETVLSCVLHALENLEFGTVTIVVQNGRVVQVERHERLRLLQSPRD